MEFVRVLLADDHPLVRGGIRVLVEQTTGFRVVAEAENGKRAVQLAHQHHPELVLMDITMPDMDGLQATARLVKEVPDTRVIILSMHTEKKYVLHSFEAGAKGYLLKGAQIPELELAMTTVASGGLYISPGASESVIEAAVQHASEEDAEHGLTAREREVLYYLAKGEGRKAIALRMNVSPKTVDAYRAELMRKLDIHDIAGLVRYALKSGVIQPEE